MNRVANATQAVRSSVHGNRSSRFFRRCGVGTRLRTSASSRTGHQQTRQTPSNAVICPAIARWRWPLVASALALLFPCMGQKPDRSRQAEEAARQWWRASQIRLDDRSGTVDIQWNGLAAFDGQTGLDSAGDPCETSRYVPFGCGLVDERQQAWRTGIDRLVKTVAEAGNEAPLLGAPRIERLFKGIGGRTDALVEHDRLFPGAAMHITQHVEPGGHGVVEPHTAGRRHACRRDRRGLRPMINGGNEAGFQQTCTRAVDRLTRDHQPDHLGKTTIADQLLDRMPAKRNATRLHVDDRCTPPVGNIAHITPSPSSSRSSPRVRPREPNTAALSAPSMGGGSATAGGRPLILNPVRTTSMPRVNPGTASKCATRPRSATCGCASASGTPSTAPAGTPMALSSFSQTVAGRVVRTVSSSARRRSLLVLRSSRVANSGRESRSSRFR